MNLINKLFPKSDSAEPAHGGQRTCEAGHALDPSWGGVCPYCEAIKRGRDKTAPISNVQASVQPSAAANDRRTRIGESIPPVSRATRVDSDMSGSPKPPADPRRITGVLACFTWQAAGELFPLREGKNTIGAGSLSEEGHRPCEIQIRTDPEMSKEHALILCRHGKYEIADLNSSNGTFLNGEMISSQAVELTNNAKIKAGATVFQFLKIEAHAQPGGVPVSTQPKPDDPDAEDEPDNLTSIG